MKSSYQSAVIIYTLLAGLSAVLIWQAWDRSANHGRESGYYGEFNRVSKALASIPGVEVRKSWYNADLSLEEFGFEVEVEGRTLPLQISEGDSIRRMNQDTAAAALKGRLALELGTF